VGATLLLDGKSAVSSQQLVCNMLKAALLAHERAGTIRLETTEKTVLGVMRSNSLVLVPTGREVDWPSTTLEARLMVSQRANVSDVVFDWLGEESADPWGRAAEQGKTMLVLRGLAAVNVNRWGTRKYILRDGASRDLSQIPVQPAEDLLADCRRNRAEIWKLLDKEIEEAVARRTHRPQSEQDHFNEVDPWLAEGAADEERLVAHAKPAILPSWVAPPLGIVLSFLCWRLAVAMELGAFAAVTASILTVGLGLFSLRFQRSGDVEKRIRAWIKSRARVSMPVPDPAPSGPAERIVWLFVWIPILTAVAVFCGAFLREHPTVWLLIGGVAVYGFYLWSRKKAAAAINARVMGVGARAMQRPVAKIDRQEADPPMVGPAKAETAAATERPAGPGDATSPIHRAIPMALEVVAPDALPPTSDESRRRVEAISLRAPSIRSTYRKGIIFLAGSTTLLATVCWLTGPAPFALAPVAGIRVPERMPLFLPIVLVVTLLLLHSRTSFRIRGAVVGTFLSAFIGVRATVKRTETDEAGASIRPAGLALMGGAWVAAALLMTPFRYASLPAPRGLLFSVASLAFALGYLYWVQRTTTALERRYPYHAPLDLLALRVFGSPNLSDFLYLTNAWQWIGTRQMLDGPDTVGQRTADLINYYLGRVGDSIVEDAGELRKALADFRTQPDRELRFPVNSMQCSDATWKEALQHLLATADVVVMDLSSLSEENRGIAHELGRLVDQVPLQRAILLINDSTEMDVLTDILAQAWENMASDSPNRDTAEPRLRLYQIGGSSERSPDESLYDWQRRQRSRLDAKPLVCLLYDAAQPPRVPATIDPKRDQDLLRWSRVPMPALLRKGRNVLFVLLLFVVLLASSCNLISAIHSG
jgi:hypothetical protein